MKRLCFLKILDVLVQLAITLYLLVYNGGASLTEGPALKHWLLACGTWQLLSAGMHYTSHRLRTGALRQAWCMTTLYTLLMGVIFFLLSFVIIGIPFLLFVVFVLSPFLIFWYWLMCIGESVVLCLPRRRPLDQIR